MTKVGLLEDQKKARAAEQGDLGEKDSPGKERGRGSCKTSEDIVRKAVEASGGVLSGEGSEFLMEKLSLASAGWRMTCWAVWRLGGDGARDRSRGLL